MLQMLQKFSLFTNFYYPPMFRNSEFKKFYFKVFFWSIWSIFNKYIYSSVIFFSLIPKNAHLFLSIFAVIFFLFKPIFSNSFDIFFLPSTNTTTISSMVT